MDRMIYVAMTGAKHLLEQQAVTAHNLANASTPGFRADTNAFRAVHVMGEGLPTRSFVINSTPGVDFRPGPVMRTGRDLDVAVQGGGWIAVQMPDGGEAYTRNGNFHIGAGGLLQVRDGVSVMGDGGPIAIPPDISVEIARDGTVSAVPAALKKTAISSIGRIKLVKPDESALVKGSDGFFRLRNGGAAEADASVGLAVGSLEGSNVNLAEAMVAMIANARQYDLQMKLLQNADANERQAAQVLALNR